MVSVMKGGRQCFEGSVRVEFQSQSLPKHQAKRVKVVVKQMNEEQEHEVNDDPRLQRLSRYHPDWPSIRVTQID
jgi:hypothetical protein